MKKQMIKKKTLMEMMSIKGIGTDIIEIERLKTAIKRRGDALINRLLTTKEQKYCFKFKDPYPHIAARFAAKEAAVKSLGIGFGKSVSFLDLEIINDKLGKPTLKISDRVMKKFNNPNILISLSHSDKYAVAFAISNL